MSFCAEIQVNFKITVQISSWGRFREAGKTQRLFYHLSSTKRKSEESAEIHQLQMLWDKVLDYIWHLSSITKHFSKLPALSLLSKQCNSLLLHWTGVLRMKKSAAVTCVLRRADTSQLGWSFVTEAINCSEPQTLRDITCDIMLLFNTRGKKHVWFLWCWDAGF